MHACHCKHRIAIKHSLLLAKAQNTCVCWVVVIICLKKIYQTVLCGLFLSCDNVTVLVRTWVKGEGEHGR